MYTVYKTAEKYYRCSVVWYEMIIAEMFDIKGTCDVFDGYDRYKIFKNISLAGDYHRETGRGARCMDSDRWQLRKRG